MERRAKSAKRRTEKSKSVESSSPGTGSKVWEFMKTNAKGLVDTIVFAAASGTIYALGESMGGFFMQQLPTEESTKAYYNQLLSEARGAAQ